MNYYVWSGLSTDTKPTTAGIGALALETDTGNEYKFTGSEWNPSGSNGADHVATPDMVAGSLVWNEIANLTTTRQSLTFPSGATAIEFSYRQGSSSGNTAATGRATYIVFNPTSDDDANGKLALAGARERLPLGDDYGALATDEDPFTRVDVISEAAEGGHSTLMISARIPS